LLGLLLPLLLLMPEADQARRRARQRRRSGSGAPPSAPTKAARAADWAEAGLRALLPPGGRRPRDGEMPPGLAFALRWWVLVTACWGACCAAAPLFAQGRGG
jgi:hypothetical protein